MQQNLRQTHLFVCFFVFSCQNPVRDQIFTSLQLVCQSTENQLITFIFAGSDYKLNYIGFSAASQTKRDIR